MAEPAGFEPTGDGVKVRCLTAWLHPNKKEFRSDMRTIQGCPHIAYSYGVEDGTRTHGLQCHKLAL